MLNWFRKTIISVADRLQQRFGRTDPLLWTRDLEEHSCGEFSLAVLRSSVEEEDRSEVHRATNAIFVGLYDGHGGDDASSFLEAHLFKEITFLAAEQGDLNTQTLENAINVMEKFFIYHVRNFKYDEPTIVRSGTSCLIGVVFARQLHIANLGDSRAVVGYLQDGTIFADQLTLDHSVERPGIRQEVKNAHPDDPDVIITLENGTFSIKGQIQLSRSIGDANMKHDVCEREYELPGIVDRPYLTSNPQLVTRDWGTRDKFVIFASHGFWDQIGTLEAVRFVHKNPKRGIARKLVREAQKVAVRRKQMSNPNFRYKDLISIPRGERKDYHDDIVVVVVFIKYENLGRRRLDTPIFQVLDADKYPIPVESAFDRIEHLMEDNMPPNNN